MPGSTMAPAPPPKPPPPPPPPGTRPQLRPSDGVNTPGSPAGPVIAASEARALLSRNAVRTLSCTKAPRCALRMPSRSAAATAPASAATTAPAAGSAGAPPGGDDRRPAGAARRDPEQESCTRPRTRRREELAPGGPDAAAAGAAVVEQRDLGREQVR